MSEKTNPLLPLVDRLKYRVQSYQNHLWDFISLTEWAEKYGGEEIDVSDYDSEEDWADEFIPLRLTVGMAHDLWITAQCAKLTLNGYNECSNQSKDDLNRISENVKKDEFAKIKKLVSGTLESIPLKNGEDYFDDENDDRKVIFQGGGGHVPKYRSATWQELELWKSLKKILDIVEEMEMRALQSEVQK